jgi:hypothetical protein
MTATPSPSSPYVTLIFTGRNDNFGGDFNERFFRALRFNHEALTAACVSHDFVFVEWRPLEDRPYLATVLRKERIVPEFLLTSFVVDCRYHDALSLNPRLQFQEFIAKNVGVRRAAGAWVLTTNTDIYLSRAIIERLAAQTLEAGTLYRAERRDIKSNVDLSLLDWSLLEDERNCDVINQIRPPFFTNASGDFILLDRDSYHRLRGFNEIYRVAKIHIDSNLCFKAHSAGVRLVDIGAPVYHVGHGTLNAQLTTYRDRPGDAPWGNIRWNNQVVYVNFDDWGLARAPQQALDARTTLLKFDWRAVAPMVELGRVVFPSARKEQDAQAVT